MAKKKKDSKTPLKPEIKGIYLFSFAWLMLASQISFASGHDKNNILGLIGYFIGWLLHGLFGLPSYFIVFFIGWCGWRFLFKNSVNQLKLKSFYLAIIVLSSSMLLSMIEDKAPQLSNGIRSVFYPGFRFHLGGSLFYYIYSDLPAFNLSRIVNSLGVGLIFSSTLLAGVMLLFKITPFQLLEWLKALFPVPERKERPVMETAATPLPEAAEDADFMRYVKLRIPKTSTKKEEEPAHEIMEINPETNLKARPSLSSKSDREAFKGEAEASRPPPPTPFPKETFQKEAPPKAPKTQKNPANDYGKYDLPSLKLLTNPKVVDQSSLKRDLKKQAEVLEETLQSFSIEAKVGQINCGPTITSFEVHPSIGVKVQKIKALENDIALNMEAKSIRIIAPIPGKAAVGIEVPNPHPQEVSFKEMLHAYQQSETKFKIPVLLGKAVNGDYVMSDLTKMPHCIIAGATGSGKSVCINTIIMSIVMNAKPDQIKLVMVDPKKVELTPYTHLPHMLAPVITEPKEACMALNWLVKEMEKRYELLKLLGCRNIEAFNNRTPNLELEKSLDVEVPAHMPYLVGLIDELADLMMVSASDIETPIARIAQMARAVGIHLILATQRPSREVITGLIKANFPTRISFKVASRVNSQIVLDEIGAESLLGNGDMLFLPPGSSHLIRAQGAFIRDEDINAVIKSCQEQSPTNYIISSFNAIPALENDFQDEPGDALYEQAKDTVLSTGNASTTFLQRKLKIGYARAASLIDQMESRGIVGPADGAKPRKILANRMNRPPSEPDLFDEDHD